MKQRSLWCLFFFKPAFSFFHPLSSVSTIVAKATMKGNILLHNLAIIPSYYDGKLSIRRGTSNDDQSSSFSLMQQGGVTFLPFLSSILNFISQQRICIALCYILLANTIYLQRRSYLRKMTKRKLLKIRTTREEGVGILMYMINIMVWQLFVTIIFPILEPLSMFPFIISIQMLMVLVSSLSRFLSSICLCQSGSALRYGLTGIDSQ